MLIIHGKLHPYTYYKARRKLMIILVTAIITCMMALCLLGFAYKRFYLSKLTIYQHLVDQQKAQSDTLKKHTTPSPAIQNQAHDAWYHRLCISILAFALKKHLMLSGLDTKHGCIHIEFAHLRPHTRLAFETMLQTSRDTRIIKENNQQHKLELCYA